MTKNSSTDKITTLSVLGAIALIAIPIALYPKESADFIRSTYLLTVDIFGATYMIFGACMLLFVLYIAFSKFGNHRLGGNDIGPDYSLFSWACMLFCSGIGGGILYWSIVEWAYYAGEGLFGIEPFSDRAYHLASAYGVFHWGFTGWALYTIPAIAVAVPFYKHNIGSLRLSSALRTSKNNIVEKTTFGRIVDFIFVLVLIGASGGSIGLYVPIIGAGFSELLNINHDLNLDLSMLAVCTGLFAFSVYRGIYSGIRVISNINIIISLLFLLGVLALGPAGEIFTLTSQAMSELGKNFFAMNTLGIVEDSEFAEAWTIFYWAWWIALGPQVGLFVARVSKGRTLKEVVLGMLVFGSLGCFLFFSILGNYAINLELTGQMNVTQTLSDIGHQATSTKILMTLPYGEMFVLAYSIIVIIFVATSYDSVSYILASHVQEVTNDETEPARKNRLMWAFVLSILPAALFLINSNRIAMDVILLMSPPLLILFPIFIFCMLKTLRQD